VCWQTPWLQQYPNPLRVGRRPLLVGLFSFVKLL
jgi:hypothetical protein